jgi:hypothetical protein
MIAKTRETTLWTWLFHLPTVEIPNDYYDRILLNYLQASNGQDLYANIDNKIREYGLESWQIGDLVEKVVKKKLIKYVTDEKTGMSAIALSTVTPQLQPA